MFEATLLVAAVVPLVAMSVLRPGGRSLSAVRDRLAPRRALAVAAAMSVIAASAVNAGPSVAQENDMHVLSGVVTSADGAALASMKVSVFCVSCAGEPTSDPSREAARPWPAERWGEGAQLLGEATTGASGDWTVSVAEPESGSPLVIAWDPDGDHAFAEVEGVLGWVDSSGLETSLVDGGRLSGRILAGGGTPPTEGFVLIGPSEGWGDLLWYGLSLLVSDDGDYVTPGLPDGDYALRYPGGRYPGSLEAPYVAGGLFPLGTVSGGHDTSADHSLAQYSSIMGRVTDGSGSGLSGVSVYASPVGGAVSKFYASPVGGGGSATTSADGSYTIDAVAPDLYVINFVPADDANAADFLSTEVPNVGGLRGADVQLGPGGTISGHVRHVETGEPEAGAYVRLCLDGPSAACVGRSWTNDAGYFEFVGVAARSYRLIVYQYPLPDVERSIVLEEGGHEEVELRIGFRGAFQDDEGAFSEEALNSLERRGILAGTECDRDRICPDDVITRATMAVWLGRALTGEEPEPIESSRFADVVWWTPAAAHIERFADLGVTTGCGDGSRYCPDDAVTRAQMAVFLSRAYDLPEGPDPNFSDVAQDAWYAPDVAKIAVARITRGCTTDPPGYCPEQQVTRGQMAVFIHRALDTLGEVDQS